MLLSLHLGSRIAEEEQHELSSYFVETNDFKRILGGAVDIVFGPKGSGKSAIYTSLLARENSLFDAGVTLVAGEVPRGNPAFKDIVTSPPTSESEFVALWKLYLLSLISRVLDDYDINNSDATEVRTALAAEGLTGYSDGGLRTLVRKVREYVSRLLTVESFEGGLVLDPTTSMPAGVTGRITLAEPSVEMRRSGFVSVDDLLSKADQALQSEGLAVWALFDRLDVAFADNRDLEANVLRSLFRVYLDTSGLAAIAMKIFLRTDIWKTVTAGGFREASHISRTLTIRWSDEAVLHLIIRRLLNNANLVTATNVDPDRVLANSDLQREWFDRLVPAKIDVGKNPETFEWILGRVRDGQGVRAPREVIHMLEQARVMQIARLERGDTEPGEGLLFSRAAFREALPEISRVRLEQTVYAEFPDLKDHLEALRGEKTDQTVATLAGIWGVSEADALAIALRANEVGFFEQRGDRGAARFWVPFLYRPALEMVQGTAATSIKPIRYDP